MSITHLWLRRISAGCLVTVCVVVSSVRGSAGESLAQHLPQGAFASGELTQLGALVERLRESPALEAIIDSEPYRQWAASGDGRKFRGGRAVLEGQLGMNLWDAVTRTLGDQAILALYPPSSRKEPDGVLLVRLADEEVGPLIRQKLEPWIELADGKLIASERDQAWLLESNDGKAFGGLQGRWLVLASTLKLRDGTMTRLDGDSADSLAAAIAWQHPAIDPADGHDSRLSLVVDMAPIRQATGQDRLLPSKTDNPLVSLLVGGLLEVAAKIDSAQAELVVGEQGYKLQVTSAGGRDSVDAAHQTLLPAAAGVSDLTPKVARQLGGFTLCRDWAEWYRQRDQLIEARILPEYDKFETGLGTFLPGKDFAEDVLALLKEPLSFVAAAQTFPHLDGKPGMQLPAFAVVLDLRDAERGADVFQLFFQTLGTIANIEAGKDGRQPWVMSSESHQGVQLTFAKYLDRPQGEDLPAVFNYQPAAGLVGQRFIAATSLELCRDLVDTLQRQPEVKMEPTAAGRNFEFTLDPKIGAEMLEANRPLLTAKRVQNGKTLEQAAQELDTLLHFLRAMNPISLVTEVSAGQVRVRLEGGWN